jgi:hypothetical protein
MPYDPTNMLYDLVPGLTANVTLEQTFEVNKEIAEAHGDGEWVFITTIH